MCNHTVAMAEIERSLLLDSPPDEVWKAITDESLLREWLAPDVELDLRPRGALRCRSEDGEERLGTVELVEEGERLAFRWRRECAAAESRVELRLEDVEGGTRLTVTESGLEAETAPRASAGWRTRLESLRLALTELVYA
jgi:uncharacterized protein YndB with AHSA1/START domain